MTLTATAFPHLVDNFGYAPIGTALWLPDEATGMKYRDLTLDFASSGTLAGRHLRAAGFVTTTDKLVLPDTGFAFVFVLAGTVTMTVEGHEPQVLRALDSATRNGHGAATAFQFSHDAEVIVLDSLADQSTGLGTGNGEWTVSVESESDYIQGDGPRTFFRYRDLQVAATTGRRIHIHVVRSTAKAGSGGTGWHSHTMGQLFYVLRGWANLSVERQQWVRMAAGDTMCLGKGMKHNVPDFSEDYLVLEMCVPADYDTIDAPAG